MKNKKKYYEKIGNQLIKAFGKRKIEAFYFSTSEEAKDKVMEIIQNGSTVSFGGSMTIEETGILDEVKKGNYKLIDRTTAKNFEEERKLIAESMMCDYYLMSSNAITIDGELINIDGKGNRVACLCYGPTNVIIVVGMNKITKDRESAIWRAHNVASPMNTLRLNRNTPCSETGKCGECLGDSSICSYIVITRKNFVPDRIKVILVGEELGY